MAETKLLQQTVRIENRVEMVNKMTTKLDNKVPKLRDIVTALEKVEQDSTNESTQSIKRNGNASNAPFVTTLI